MYVVGIDIGGQTSKIGVVDARGTVLAQTVIRTDNHTEVDLYVAELAEAAKNEEEDCYRNISLKNIDCPF